MRIMNIIMVLFIAINFGFSAEVIEERALNIAENFFFL